VYRHLERQTQPLRLPSRPAPPTSTHAAFTCHSGCQTRRPSSSQLPRRPPRASRPQAAAGSPGETGPGNSWIGLVRLRSVTAHRVSQPHSHCGPVQTAEERSPTLATSAAKPVSPPTPLRLRRSGDGVVLPSPPASGRCPSGTKPILAPFMTRSCSGGKSCRSWRARNSPRSSRRPGAQRRTRRTSGGESGRRMFRHGRRSAR
jgi:hypothetical protein